MKKFLSTLFSSGKEKPEEQGDEQNGVNQKNFDILKYDGIRAMRMGGGVTYAIKCFTEALNIQDDFETMTHLMSAHTMAQDPESALEVADRMIEMEPDHIETRMMRINLLFMTDQDAEVIPAAEHVLELDPDNYAAYYQMAKAKRSGGDQLGAITDLTQAISKNEDFAQAYLLRSEILLDMQQTKEALDDAEKVIELLPEEETAYLLRGRIHEFMNDNEAATIDYQTVLELNPYNEEGWLVSGQLLITQGNWDEAIAHFDEAIEINSEFAKAFAERGRAKNEKGDKDGALEDLKKAIELNPEGEEAGRFEGKHVNFNDMYKGGIF